MMKQRNITGGAIMLAILFLAGCSGAKNPAAFVKWMKGAEMLKVEKACGETTFTCTYVPRSWVAYKSAGSEADYHAALDAADSEQFIFEAMISDPAASGGAFAQSLVTYADLQMPRDLALKYGDEERACLVSQVESNFTVPGRFRFILIFPGTFADGASKNISLLFTDNITGCAEQPLVFHFKDLEISRIPELHYLTPNNP